MPDRWILRAVPPTMPKWASKVGWHLVLALVMLLMQQAGLRHSLQHALQDESAPTHAVCVECLAHHANDVGATHAIPALVLVEFGHVLTADEAQPQLGHSVQTGYLPRAPPVLPI